MEAERAAAAAASVDGTPPPPPPPHPSTTTTLTSLPRDVLGAILLSVPRCGAAAASHRALAVIVSDYTFRSRHRQRHPAARRQLGAWSLGDRTNMAMAMAAYAVAVRDRARRQAAGGAAWPPAAPPLQAGGLPPSVRVRVLGAGGVAGAGGPSATAPLAVAD
jgi:hypothetical protein